MLDFFNYFSIKFNSKKNDCNQDRNYFDTIYIVDFLLFQSNVVELYCFFISEIICSYIWILIIIKYVIISESKLLPWLIIRLFCLFDDFPEYTIRNSRNINTKEIFHDIWLMFFCETYDSLSNKFYYTQRSYTQKSHILIYTI